MNNLSHQHIYILIAPDFDEIATVYYISKLRDEGLPVKLTGLTSGWISGRRGIQLRTDAYMSQLSASDLSASHLLILAGGDECTSVLLADPRVYDWVQTIFERKGIVVAMSPVAKKLLADTGFLKNKHYSHLLLQQQGVDTLSFVDGLIQRISG